MDKEKRIIPLLDAENLATPPPANHHCQFPPSCSRIFNHSQPLALRDYNPLFLQNSFQHLPEGEREQTCVPLLSPNPDIQDEISEAKTISVLCPHNPKKNFLWPGERAEQGSPPSTLLLARTVFYPIQGSFPARLAALEVQLQLSSDACPGQLVAHAYKNVLQPPGISQIYYRWRAIITKGGAIIPKSFRI